MIQEGVLEASVCSHLMYRTFLVRYTETQSRLCRHQQQAMLGHKISSVRGQTEGADKTTFVVRLVSQYS